MRALRRRGRLSAARRSIVLALTTAGFTAPRLAGAPGPGASGSPDRITGSPRRESLPSGGQSSNRPFGGVAAVGALFTGASGRLKRHLCTASVIDSPGGDI